MEPSSKKFLAPFISRVSDFWLGLTKAGVEPRGMIGSRV